MKNFSEVSQGPGVLLLQGGNGFGKKTLARHLSREFFPEAQFMTFTPLTKSQGSWTQKKIFLYVQENKLKSEEERFLIQSLLEEKKIAFLVYGHKGKKESPFPHWQLPSVSLKLPPFPEREEDHCLILSHFMDQLSPQIPLSHEAFLYYVRRQVFKSVFELKYALLLSHYQTEERRLGSISALLFKESLKFVRNHEEDFRIFENFEFSSLLTLIDSFGYKKCLDSFEEILIEKIFLESKSSYTKSSYVTKLPVTTLRSKRLKYLKKS